MNHLMGLQFCIIYKKGPDNTVIDALSRLLPKHTLNSLTTINLAWFQEVLNSYVTDVKAQQLLQ
jgi:hypothetical protein